VLRFGPEALPESRSLDSQLDGPLNSEETGPPPSGVLLRRELEKVLEAGGPI
jgi:hypothetical protein